MGFLNVGVNWQRTQHILDIWPISFSANKMTKAMSITLKRSMGVRNGLQCKKSTKTLQESQGFKIWCGLILMPKVIYWHVGETEEMQAQMDTTNLQKFMLQPKISEPQVLGKITP